MNLNHNLPGSRLLALIVVLVLVCFPRIAYAQCQMTLLQPPGVKAGDFYGSSIHVERTQMIIGAPGGDLDNPHEGYADYYIQNNGEWIFHSRITQPYGQPTDRFGEAVMIRDNFVYITAPNHHDFVTSTSGALYVFYYQNDKWNLFGVGSGDSFGFGPVSMASYLSTAVIGHTVPWGCGGVVYIYGFYRGRFNLLSILNPGPGITVCERTQFGYSVDVAFGGSPYNDHRVVVGAPNDNEAEHWATRGAVHIYEFSGFDGMIETAKLLAPTYSYGFGTSVAVSEFRVFVTQLNYIYSEAAVSVYKIDNDQWSLENFLEFPNHVGTRGPALALNSPPSGLPTMLIGSINCIRPELPSSSCIVDVAKVYAFDDETQQWDPKLSLRYEGFDLGTSNSTVAWLEQDFAILGFPQLDEPFENAGGVLVFNGLSGADNNNNGLPDACDIPGDASGDGLVNVTDLLILLSSWGPCSACPADINADRVVNILDLLAIFGNWG